MIPKKYFLYGSSILLGRGLEYIVVIFLAGYLSKQSYGEFEYAKKIVEFGAIVFGLGFPVLLQTQTKSSKEKQELLIFSFLTVTGLVVIAMPILSYFNFLTYVIPLLFYVFFFHSGSIIQSFQLVYYPGKTVTLYKVVAATIFASLLCFFSYYFNDGVKGFIYTGSICLGLGFLYLMKVFLSFEDFRQRVLSSDISVIKMFKTSSLLVLESIFNMAFLLSDIIIIEHLSRKEIAFENVAKYSFPMNIAGALMMVSMAVIQMEIENLKTDNSLVKSISKKLNQYLIMASSVVLVAYCVLVNFILPEYSNTILIFVVLLATKFFLSSSMSHGTVCLINARYKNMLIIAFVSFVGNIVFSYITFSYIGVYGVALSSLFFVFLRYFFLRKIVNDSLEIRTNK